MLYSFCTLIPTSSVPISQPLAIFSHSLTECSRDFPDCFTHHLLYKQPVVAVNKHSSSPLALDIYTPSSHRLWSLQLPSLIAQDLLAHRPETAGSLITYSGHLKRDYTFNLLIPTSLHRQIFWDVEHTPLVLWNDMMFKFGKDQEWHCWPLG